MPLTDPEPIPPEILSDFEDARRRVYGLGGRVSIHLDLSRVGKPPEWTVTIEAGTKPLTGPE